MNSQTRRCPHCGSLLMEACKSVPYIGPGARLVELRDVRAMQCQQCDHLELRLTDRGRLDSMIISNVAKMSEQVPTVEFMNGTWRLR
jgi:YgiT-type zinc finger domain-containing protein